MEDGGYLYNEHPLHLSNTVKDKLLVPGLKTIVILLYETRRERKIQAISDNRTALASLPREYKIIMFLLALHIGPYQKIMNEMLDYFHNKLPEETLSAHIDEFRGGFIIKDEGTPKKLSNEVADLYQSLYMTICSCKFEDTIFKLKREDCRKHLEFIRRFTFAELI